MMKDNRSKLQLYSAAFKRLVMINIFPSTLKLILISEFPKSGGSWFGQMFSEASGIPFPRNIMPAFSRNIMHGHYLFHPRMQKLIHVLRDGRDVMVSAYFHFLFNNSHNHPKVVSYTRNRLSFDDYEDIQKNLPYFIEYMFTGYARKNRLHFSWSEAVRNIQQYRSHICVVKYEDLLTNPIHCLEQTLAFYQINSPGKAELKKIVENYSFNKVTSRNPGEEDRQSFVRKGISGDWKNYFSDEACEIFKRFAGKELIQMGYENDNSWFSHLK